MVKYGVKATLFTIIEVQNRSCNGADRIPMPRSRAGAEGFFASEVKRDATSCRVCRLSFGQGTGRRRVDRGLQTVRRFWAGLDMCRGGSVSVGYRELGLKVVDRVAEDLVAGCSDPDPSLWVSSPSPVFSDGSSVSLSASRQWFPVISYPLRLGFDVFPTLAMSPV